MKTLRLTLNKKAFEVMVTGEKAEEFRKPSKWIMSRLKNKDGSDKKYDFVHFVNGYGSDKPYFICKYIGFFENTREIQNIKYSNGLSVDFMLGDIDIILGQIVERGNLKQYEKSK